MAMVKVWNDNVHPYKEQFRDKNIDIPAKGCIEMEYHEAVLFKGSFSMPILDGDGQHDPRGYKMIRVEEPSFAQIEDSKVDALLCQACRYLAKSKNDLFDHYKTHAEDHAVDEVAEQEIKRRGRPAKTA